MEHKALTLSDIIYLPVDVPSHTLPFLGFLTDLQAKGLNFDIYGPPTLLKNILPSHGQNHFEFDELTLNMKEGVNSMIKTVYESMLKNIPAIEAIWETNGKKPKLIIADMFATYAKVLAKKHDIPLLVLYSSYFIGNMNLPFEETEKMLAVPRDESLAPLDREVEEKYQISVKSIKDVLIEGDYNVSCLPKFIGDHATFDKEFFEYLGPAFREEGDHQQINIDPGFLKDNEIIYVCLGTTGLNAKGFSCYDSIVEVFKDTDHKVVISAAFGKAEELIAKGLPKNIIVKNWVPQMKVLQHSKLFITHAGAGGMMESLSLGVPMIAVPNFADQPVNAKVIEKLNVGRWLKDQSLENIKKVVEEILGNKNIKESCLKAKEKLSVKTAKSRFVDIVGSLIN